MTFIAAEGAKANFRIDRDNFDHLLKTNVTLTRFCQADLL